MAERCLPDVLVIEEIKLNEDFKTELFVMNNYQYPMRRDRNEFGGDIMQYVRKGVVCNRITAYETQNVESICSELIISKKRWMIFAVYRPPDSANLNSFLTSYQIP